MSICAYHLPSIPKKELQVMWKRQLWSLFQTHLNWSGIEVLIRYESIPVSPFKVEGNVTLTKLIRSGFEQSHTVRGPKCLTKSPPVNYIQSHKRKKSRQLPIVGRKERLTPQYVVINDDRPQVVDPPFSQTPLSIVAIFTSSRLVTFYLGRETTLTRI